MSLENTLRKLLNEMKVPESKPPLDPTVHTGPEKPPLPSTVLSPAVKAKPAKPAKPESGVPVNPAPSVWPSRDQMMNISGKKPPEPEFYVSPGLLGWGKRRDIKEYFKQRLEDEILEEGLLGRIGKQLQLNKTRR